MQEITREILQVFDDLQRMQNQQEQNGVGEADKDSFGYPFEPYDAFSTSPLEFTETALRLDIEAREMFSILRSVNRHSPMFYKLSGPFEKLLSQLGSCCITKAMIEQQEAERFELLQDLTIDGLREMTGFLFRKSSTAFMDSRACGKINAAAFTLSVRWAALDKRLIATEEKIKSGRWSVAGDQKDEGQGELEIRNQISEIRNGSDEQAVGKRELPVSAFSEKGRALPVLEGTVRGGTEGCRRELSPETRDGKIRNQKSEIRYDLSSQQETNGTVFADSELSQQNCPDRPGMQEKEKQGAWSKVHESPQYTVPGAQQYEGQGTWGMGQEEETGVYWKDPPEEEWEEEVMMPEWAVVK